MTVLLPYRGAFPDFEKAAFVAPNATLLGAVKLGEDASIWFGAVLRGDVQAITVGARTNIQDNAVVHASTGLCPTVIGDDCTIGHSAIIHGATLGNGVLIGMGAIVLDEAEIGDEACIGAGALVTGKTKIPPGALVLGSPAKVVRIMSEPDKAVQRYSAPHYVDLAREYEEAVAKSRT